MLHTAVFTTLLLCLACLITFSETKVVVVIPFPYTSHTKYHTNAALALAKKGHEVWVTIPTYLLKKDHLNTHGFNVLPYDALPRLEERIEDAMSRYYFEGKRDDLFKFLRICGAITDTLLKNESFIAVIEQKYPDFIVIDNLSMFYTMSVLPYKLGVPFAFLGTVYYPPMLKIPFLPAEVPLPLFPYTNNMTFFHKLHTTLNYMLFSVYYPSFPVDAADIYAPDMVYMPLNDLVMRAEMFLVELDTVLDDPKPTLPNVKLIGGSAAGPRRGIDCALGSFMKKAKEGVVIVSFGSYVHDLPKHLSDKIFQVLLELPMKSVIRSNLASPDPEKIVTLPWIPQNDLLGHPHTKVFVSHCGKNGQYEALYHAVPVVATPLSTDQFDNAERARVKGFAQVLDLKTCTVEELKSIILSVANEPRYREAVNEHSKLFREQRRVPMETAAYWLDQVMENVGKNSQSQGQQIPTYQNMLPYVFVGIVCLLLVVLGLVCVCIKALCRCFEKTKTKTD